MKKFLVRFLLFCIASIVIYPFLIGSLGSYWLTQRRLTKNLIFNQGGNSFLWSKFQNADTTKNIDILILGSSIALRGIDTRVFEKYGYRAFNLGSNYQTPIQTEYLLNKYLNQFSPKYVIWEVTPITFQNKGLESFIDVFSNTEIGIEAIEQGLKISDMIGWNTLIVSLGRQKFGNFYNYKEPTNKWTNRYVNGGFIETNNLDFDDRDEMDLYSLDFLDYQKTAFEKILLLLNNYDVKVVLVQSPTTTEYYTCIVNWNDINSYFKSFKEKGFIINYRNYNEIFPEFGEKINFFTDNMHLNRVGANEFTELLYKDLQSSLMEGK